MKFSILLLCLFLSLVFIIPIILFLNRDCCSHSHYSFPIDALITWVDSTDKQWLAEKQKHQQTLSQDHDNKNRWNASLKDTEIEIRTCLKCILKYIPWINTIHLVTAYPQKPACLQTDKVLKHAFDTQKIVIVHHHEFFLDQTHLPTFSSEAIETNLHLIESLSEHFLYFNDDMYVTKYVSPDMFFNAEGKAIFYGRKEKNQRQKIICPKNEPYYCSRTRTNNLLYDLNYRTVISEKHQFKAFNKSTLKLVTEKFWNIFVINSETKFRSPEIYRFLNFADNYACKHDLKIFAKNQSRFKGRYYIGLFTTINKHKHALCINNCTDKKCEKFIQKIENYHVP